MIDFIGVPLKLLVIIIRKIHLYQSGSWYLLDRRQGCAVQGVHYTQVPRSRGHLRTENEFGFQFCKILVGYVNLNLFFLILVSAQYNPHTEKVPSLIPALLILISKLSATRFLFCLGSFLNVLDMVVSFYTGLVLAICQMTPYFSCFQWLSIVGLSRYRKLNCRN